MSTSLTTSPTSAVPPALLRLPVVGPTLVSLERRLSAPEATRLPDTLVELFLKAIIDARADELATLGGQRADILPHIHKLYLERLTEQIANAARVADPRALPRAASPSLETRLASLRLPNATLGDFASATQFTALLSRSRVDLTWRGGIRPSPVTVRERTLVGAILLRALQEVVFEAIESDHTTPSHTQDIPVGVESAIAAVLDTLANTRGRLASREHSFRSPSHTRGFSGRWRVPKIASGFRSGRFRQRRLPTQIWRITTSADRTTMRVGLAIRCVARTGRFSSAAIAVWASRPS